MSGTWHMLHWDRDEKMKCLNIHHWFEIAKAHGKTAAQVALGYLMQSGVIVIPKSVHEERIKENADLFDFKLSADEMESLVKIDMAVPMIGDPEKSRHGRISYGMVRGEVCGETYFIAWGDRHSRKCCNPKTVIRYGSSTYPVCPSCWRDVFGYPSHDGDKRQCGKYR